MGLYKPKQKQENMIRIFEKFPFFDSREDGIFFKKPYDDIYDLELHLTFQSSYVEIEPRLSYLGQIRFIFKLIVSTVEPSGYLLVDKDVILPDVLCVDLFDHLIDIESYHAIPMSSTIPELDKSIYVKYDQAAIRRRVTLKSLIDE